MSTPVTAAHHFIWRHLYASMQAAQTPASKLRFVTPDKESSMNTLWHAEDFEQICRELLTEMAVEIEKTISAKEHEIEQTQSTATGRQQRLPEVAPRKFT